MPERILLVVVCRFPRRPLKPVQDDRTGSNEEDFHRGVVEGEKGDSMSEDEEDV